MRARDFELLVGRGGSGYIPHPHDTLQLTAYNPDNRAEAKLVAQQAWRASWSAPEINELMDKGVAQSSAANQAQIYHHVQELIEQEVSWELPISQRLDPVAVHKQVQSYQGSPSWMVRWEVVSKTD